MPGGRQVPVSRQRTDPDVAEFGTPTSPAEPEAVNGTRRLNEAGEQLVAEQPSPDRKPESALTLDLDAFEKPGILGPIPQIPERWLGGPPSCYAAIEPQGKDQALPDGRGPLDTLRAARR